MEISNCDSSGGELVTKNMIDIKRTKIWSRKHKFEILPVFYSQTGKGLIRYPKDIYDYICGVLVHHYVKKKFQGPKFEKGSAQSLILSCCLAYVSSAPCGL